nr:centrosomal protein of 162 kDa [Loxodonta africana]
MAHYSREELDEEFEQFMKELSDDSFENSNKTPRQTKKEEKKKDTVPWWITEDDFEGGGLLGTNVSYLKTRKTSQPIMEIEEESAEKIEFLKSSGTSILSIDSLETNELVVSELNHSILGLGLDTLEEQEEKEQFFARLETGLTSSIDYSRLNKELDSNDSTHFKALLSNQANIELTEDGHENKTVHEELAENYSDDFEEEEDTDAPLATKEEESHSKENPQSEKVNVPKQEEEKTGMLANVVLLDSLDSIVDVNLDEQDKAASKPQAPPEMTNNEMTGTGISYGQSNSDIEALQQAYHHIAHSLGDTDKQRFENNAVENTKNSVKDHPQDNDDESSKNNSTTESDLPTVEELMKPIRIDSFGVSGFDLQPVSSKILADNKETEFVSPLLKTNSNVKFQEPHHVNQFFDKNDENVVLQKTANEGIENSCPRVTATEEHIDKMYLDVLRRKLSVDPSLLPQDDKINKTLISQLSFREEGAVIGKELLYKKARSAPPLLKRKPQSGLYASVRSSGYGKPNSPSKTFSTLEKKTSKDIMKNKNLRSVPTSNQARKKGNRIFFLEIICFCISLNIKKEKNSLLEDIKILKQDKQALEVDLEKMKKERDQAKDQIAYATGEKVYEIKILEETHKQEISRLQKRLQWYAENQELLDKDAVRLKEANEEIEKLKLEIEKLKAESGNPSIQQKIRLKDKAVDAKKIQDLERQVKEMEGILKRRYPNSLPALILAASAAGDTVNRNTVEFMEKRIKKLEADLEGKDEEAKKSLRTMEQQFQKMKIQYEQRLEEQEQLLANKLKEAAQNQRDNPVAKALEKELSDIKEAHQITVRNLEAEIDMLKHQNAELELKKNDKDDKDFQSLEFQVEQAHAKAKLVRLNEELAAKAREIQDLSKTVERLQKERRMMLSNQNSKGREEMSTKKVKKDVLHTGKGNANSSGTLDDKLYQPHTFTDSHTSDVLQENFRLKNELQRVILERNELKMKSEAASNQFENSMKRLKEDNTAHIASLKASHQREVEKLLCQNAVEKSSSKVAELNRKIATQEVLIKHFQNQVNELQGKQESLVVSQVREEILQNEVTKLLEELREAKENHTPEMKHFTGLEKKIKQMEMRHEQREQELQQIIQQTRQVVETEQNKETEKWKRLAQLKNRELDKFRTELDSILDVLRELHRQGVVFPAAVSEDAHAPDPEDH